LAFGCLIEAEMEIVVMSNKDRDASSATIESTPEKSAHKTHPAPPMVWMLLPVALLALLAFLSR
jgi:hypothetical protein